MCGIVGFYNQKNVEKKIYRSLQALEYRGYDSSGISVLSEKGIQTIRSKGELAHIENSLKEISGSTGIGHTRWATHGEASERNAHPHFNDKVSLVHNGIIENYHLLKKDLGDEVWNSETDTEVILKLLTHRLLEGKSPLEALLDTVKKLEGSFAIAVIFSEEPLAIYGARKGSPLIVGEDSEGNLSIASDTLAFLGECSEAYYPEDESIIKMSETGLNVWNFGGQINECRRVKIDEVNLNPQKGPFDHFMLKEIHEQPSVIKRLLDTYVSSEGSEVKSPCGVEGLNLGKISHIQIVACGTAYHAALLGKYYLESHVRLPVTVELASEFRYSEKTLTPKTLFVAISQSGETADTLACVVKAVQAKCQILSFCNRKQSELTRLSTKTIYLLCGPEISVAATKSFSAMVLCLYLFALSCGRNRGLLSKEALKRKLKGISDLPESMATTLENGERISEIANKYKEAKAFFFIGRRWHYPIALEGALKLKEISYIHAEGLGAGEFKHGTLALVGDQVPIVSIAPRDSFFPKTMANVKEVATRSGRIIGVGTQEDSELRETCEDFIGMSSVSEEVLPLISNMVLQLLSYEIASQLGTSIDKPKNLAKSVTVE